jgi:hypothetical protein
MLMGKTFHHKGNQKHATSNRTNYVGPDINCIWLVCGYKFSHASFSLDVALMVRFCPIEALFSLRCNQQALGNRPFVDPGKPFIAVCGKLANSWLPGTNTWKSSNAGSRVLMRGMGQWPLIPHPSGGPNCKGCNPSITQHRRESLTCCYSWPGRPDWRGGGQTHCLALFYSTG